MSPWIWSALLLGLGGSLHCAGMCGPLLLCLPQPPTGKQLLFQLVYHAGRISVYVAGGCLFALAGHQLELLGFQQYLSLAVGVLLLSYLLLQQLRLEGTPLAWLGRWPSFIRKQFGVLLRNDSFFSRFGMGMLNGLLPCGLVYAALAGAAVTGNVLEGGVYMLLFGAGTLPLLLGLQFGSGKIFLHFRSYLQKSKMVLTLLMAALLLFRGLNLGIPYLSPKFSQDAACHTTQANCCHK